MKVKLLLVMFVLSGLTGITLSVAQTNSKESTDQLSQSEALGLIRRINTIEAEMKLKGQSYGSLEGLLKEPRFQQRQFAIDVDDSSSGSLKNYKMSVVVSADGQHYQVSLRPAQGCVMLFSAMNPV